MSIRDEKYMRLALELAAKAQDRTRPNPMVGAVVVRSGKVVGQGFHRRAGGPHAEVLALAQAGRSAQGATLYISLEPCAHTGRTPPCIEEIFRSGIRRVVAAMIDPNPLNRGRGFKWLRAHGIRTRTGILQKEARSLNQVFVTWKEKGRPFVTVKVAQSMDGKIATPSGQSQWISKPKARRWVQRFRSQVDAILVGVETVLKDDPQLTVRSILKPPSSPVSPKQPLKVVLDSHLRTPPTARLFASKTPVIIATTRMSSRKKEQLLRQKGAEVFRLPSREGKVSVMALLKELAQREISHLLVEGGGQTIASFFQQKAVDQIFFIIAPLVIGGKDAPTSVEGRGIHSLKEAISLKNISLERLGGDLLVQADV